MNRYLDIAPEVQEALKNGKPVVALESTIISHGMPYPQNVETAQLAIGAGALACTSPETIHPGMSWENIEYILNKEEQ